MYNTIKNLTLSIFALILLSCSNDDDSSINPTVDIPLGRIVAEIDGIETSFEFETKAIIDTIPWNFGQNAVKLSISGKKTNNNNSENILIWFFVTPEREIDEVTYPDLNKQIYHYLEFNNLWREDLYNYGSNRYVDEFYSSTSTIIKTDSIIQGVFSGNVGIGVGAIGDEQPPLYHKIRNGQFNLILER